MRIRIQDSIGNVQVSDQLVIEGEQTEGELRDALEELYKNVFQRTFLSMKIATKVTYFNPAHIVSIRTID